MKCCGSKKYLTGLFLICFSSTLSSQEYNPSEAKIKVIRLTDKMYKLQCVSGTYVNTVALVGDEGVLMVDTGYPQTGLLLKEEIKQLGYGDVEIVINTHEHNDHTAGNVQFIDNAVFVSHPRRTHRAHSLHGPTDAAVVRRPSRC